MRLKFFSAGHSKRVLPPAAGALPLEWSMNHDELARTGKAQMADIIGDNARPIQDFRNRLLVSSK